MTVLFVGFNLFGFYRKITHFQLPMDLMIKIDHERKSQTSRQPTSFLSMDIYLVSLFFHCDRISPDFASSSECSSTSQPSYIILTL